MFRFKLRIVTKLIISAGVRSMQIKTREARLGVVRSDLDRAVERLLRVVRAA